MRSNLFWLSDEQWKRIQPHLPTDVRGVERADDRRVISGIVHVLKSGCRWCDCPPEYGPPTTIYNRFVRWARRGIWENLFRAAGRGKSRPVALRGSRCLIRALDSVGASRKLDGSSVMDLKPRHARGFLVSLCIVGVFVSRFHFVGGRFQARRAADHSVTEILHRTSF